MRNTRWRLKTRWTGGTTIKELLNVSFRRLPIFEKARAANTKSEAAAERGIVTSCTCVKYHESYEKS